MSKKPSRSFGEWHESLWRPHEHEDHRKSDPPPDTTTIYPVDSTRQGHEELLREHSFKLSAAADQCERAAKARRNYSMYFNNKATLLRYLATSVTSMLSHMNAKDDIAKAKSFDSFSNALNKREAAPSQTDYFNSVQKGLFTGAVYAKSPELKKFHLPLDSELPELYHQRAGNYVGYKHVSPYNKERMQNYLKTAMSNADTHYAKFENRPSQGALSTGASQETERDNDSQQTHLPDENHFELDSAITA